MGHIIFSQCEPPALSVAVPLRVCLCAFWATQVFQFMVVAAMCSWNSILSVWMCVAALRLPNIIIKHAKRKGLRCRERERKLWTVYWNFYRTGFLVAKSFWVYTFFFSNNWYLLYVVSEKWNIVEPRMYVDCTRSTATTFFSCLAKIWWLQNLGTKNCFFSAAVKKKSIRKKFWFIEFFNYSSIT